MKIAVLMGGPSSEREISLKSGEAVYQALVTKGHEVYKLDLSPRTPSELLNSRPDLVFIALHGKPGEDGSVQGMLELLGIPYTGSGVLASAITMDKIVTKRLLQQAGLPTAPFLVFSRDQCLGQKLSQTIKEIRERLGLPIVVKAPTQGSTIGTYIVRSEGEIAPSLSEALQYDNRVLVEKFLEGPEVTAAVLGNEEPEVLPLIEIISHTGFYDYKAKYTPGLSEHIIPPRLPQEVQEKIKLIAKEAYAFTGCRGFGRVDFIVAGGKDPYILEINSIPGLTSTSLLPDAARAAGYSFPDLVQKIVDLALETQKE
ncbi:MAG: D-alanine--D-alanine ligase [Thermanaeromonas sp.]|uniref:D-alanine--D-alanine ligase n=1 Tax=Thermanaeromonas sp. TaxID=2003697 RepID=UPI00243F839F|nr:D-alanine--D-alanine ligase [Thermanaeromonas sp.]MCG0278624.1 D-alanine--D-alanine ligase [Thermanaeromonas sp.]